MIFITFFLICGFQPESGAANRGADKTKSGIEISGTGSSNDEYAAADAALNSANQEGKLAGETDLYEDFTGDYSAGGVQQNIADTISYQNEMENAQLKDEEQKN